MQRTGWSRALLPVPAPQEQEGELHWWRQAGVAGEWQSGCTPTVSHLSSSVPHRSKGTARTGTAAPAGATAIHSSARTFSEVTRTTFFTFTRSKRWSCPAASALFQHLFASSNRTQGRLCKLLRHRQEVCRNLKRAVSCCFGELCCAPMAAT